MITEPLAAAPAPISASFRDPAGRLFRLGDRILRAVHSSGIPDLESFLDSPRAKSLIAGGRVIGTRRVGAAEQDEIFRDGTLAPLFETAPCEALLEHDRVPFASFPYEWPPEMLYQAAALTLDLALSLQPVGVGLKDATPYNVLFRGPEPVFIDVLSFEQRECGDSRWLPYAQFIRTFLLPLAAHKYFGVPLDQVFLTRRDGLDPEEVYGWLGPLRKLLPPFLSLVSLPTWLGRRHNQDSETIYRRKTGGDPEKAAFVFRSLLRGLRRTLEKLQPEAGRRSTWSDYLTANHTYSNAQFAAKKNFVDSALREFRPRRVLDIGCNTGVFSVAAARAGAQVVAIDSDPVVVGETWRHAHQQRLDILPLVVDLTRPTPGAGWRNRECPAFLERARGSFDAVLMLAVVHHMLVTERVPLSEIADLAAELTNDLLVVEFVAPEDPMFTRLTRGRAEPHRGLNTVAFEACFATRFEIARAERLKDSFRWLYAFRKRR